MRNTELFAGFEDHEIDRVINCLGVTLRNFTQGETLARSGERSQGIGLVLKGAAYTSVLHSDGTKRLIMMVNEGDLFGEDIFWTPDHAVQHTVTAVSDGQAWIIGMGKILSAEGPLCSLRSRIVENLFHIILAKHRELNTRLDTLSRRSLRARINGFLQEQQRLHGSPRFTVMLSRTELAQYLNADRAAVSRELARMKEDGLIDYYRGSFAITAPIDTE